MFRYLYTKILFWGQSRNSVRVLYVTSFIEAIFFPLPPDVLLIPMCLASPKKAFYLAGLTTIFSVLGGAVGYFLGVIAYDFINIILVDFGYEKHILQVQKWFENWGIWIIFLAGFTPIPYKIFTILAGASLMPFFGFLAGSFFGRGTRFFLIALLIIWGGESLKNNINKYIEYIGWAILVLILILIFLNTFTH